MISLTWWKTTPQVLKCVLSFHQLCQITSWYQQPHFWGRSEMQLSILVK